MRIPPESWNWRGTLLVLVALTAPIAAVLVLVPESRTLSSTTRTVDLVIFLSLLVCAILLYLHWRLTASPGSGWMTAGLAIASIQGLVISGLALTHSVQDARGWVVLGTLVQVLGVLGLVLLSLQFQVPADPLGLAVAAGMVLIGVELALVRYVGPLVLADSVLVTLVLLTLLAGLALAAATLQVDSVPAWARIRLALVVVLLSIGTVPTYAVEPGPIESSAALVAELAGAVLLMSTVLALLRSSIRQHHQALGELGQRLMLAESEVRDDRERLHEIGSMVAGIVSASRLVREVESLPRDRRDSLEDMLESEMGRLERLMNPDSPSSDVEPVNLDDVVAPVVVAHQARDRVVRWTPTGHVVPARADDLTEVLNVLLENAARHAPGHPVDISVQETVGRVDIVVSDTGPGIAPAVREVLYEWGSRAATSSGQGIGLHVARRMMEAQGGDLTLVDTPGPGATFVVGLVQPAEPEASCDSPPASRGHRP